MKKRIFATFLALTIIAVCSFSLTACGDEACKHNFVDGGCTKCDALAPSEGLSYSLNADGSAYMVKGIGTCEDTYVVIPAEYNGKPVSIVDTNAFRGNENITGVEIHDGVKQINPYAFKGCINLKTVKLSKTLTEIGWSSFEDCEKLIEVDVPDTVERIEFGAFRSCKSLEKVTLGKKVNSIGSYAFAYCQKIMRITLPSKVKIFGERVFIGCYKLVEVCNESSLKITVGSEDFGMVALYAKNVCKKPAQSKITVDTDGFVFYSNADENILLGKYGGLTSLPENFDGNDYSIYDYAFYLDADVTNLSVPDTVKSIGKFAFANCSNLSVLNTGNNVSSIGESAFFSCDNLGFVRFGANLKSIGANAFRDSINLAEMRFDGDSTAWSLVEKGLNWNFLIGTVRIHCFDTDVIL